MSEPLLTASEVAELLSVPESWVRQATREGRLPHVRLGRYRRYQQSQIEAWLKEQSNAPRPHSQPDLRSRPA
jgi:excisionase family DNA binding protein